MGVKRKYKVISVPDYLFIHTKRFSKNQFFKEKNPTIVQFPMTGFEFAGRKYDLAANLVHVGSATDGSYKCQLEHLGQWYEVHDLFVREVMPEQVAVSETYLLMYKATN
jgi:U4/U6.U5 tri-snRNP-associated protein 2